MPNAEQGSVIETMSQTPEVESLSNTSRSVDTDSQNLSSDREKPKGVPQSGLRGKVVVITGASAGIGRATALRFAQEGAKIAAWDVSDKAAQQLESASKWAGGEASFQAVNVTKANELANRCRRPYSTAGGGSTC